MPYFGSHEESSGTNQSQGAAPADANASRSSGQTSASGPSKSNRPSSVRLPSPGPSRMQPSSPRIQYSSSHQRNASAQTPSGPMSNDGGWSPSYVAPGPMSPSASGNLGTNSFIFPIRSVFQGINPSSDQGQGGSQQGTQGDQKSGPSNLNRRPSGAQRAVSRSDAYDGSSRRPSRASIAEGYDDDFMVSGTDVVGISTIAQMLEGVEMGGGGGGSSGGFSSMSKIDEKEDGAKRTTGHATFTGRQTQSKPLPSRDRDDHRPASTNVTPVTTDPPRPPHGFFSAPLRGGERADTDPFSDFAKEVRRSSDGDELSTRGPFHTFTSQSSISGDESGSSLRDGSASHQPSRPTVTQADSGETIPGRYAEAEERPENDSANAPDNGLLDKSKPPVGQPSEPATGINFRDRPGTTTGEEQSYDQVDSSKNVDTKPRTFATARAPKPESTTQQPELLQPRPHRVGRTSSSVSSHGTSTNRQHGVTNLEHDEQGEPNVVNDYSGIVRLADIGSHSSMMGTGTGTGTGSGQGSGVGGQSSNVKQSRKHKRERPIAENSSLSSGGPTGARLAQQQREVKDNNSRNTVQNFVNQQAHTTNMLDPNAPTPSPTPLSQSEDSETDGDNERAADERDSAQSSDVEAKWGARSESSLSVRESSEMATASTDDDDSRSRSQATDAKSKDEPIVTFRFEHVATDDGHHVVVGREGILQRCEDEPITTPGAVQGFGVLIVLEEDYEAETLIVRQVSENATELIGLSPRYLFGLDCFTRLLTEEQEDILRDNIEFLPDSESGRGSVEQEGPQVFLLSGFGEPGSEEDEDADSQGEASNRRREWTCWVAAHRPQQPTWNKVDEAGQPIPPPELIVLEFELERDIYNPLMQAFDRSDYAESDTPDSGSQTTLSRGSGPGRSSSFGSGGNNQASDGSLTTVASTPTPRPGLNTADSGESGSSGSMTTAQVQTKSSGQTTQNSGSTIRTSRGTGGHKPQGLEGIEVDHPLERIIESTTNHAKPLRALERMRRNGPFGESGSGRGSVGGSGSGRTSRGGTRSRRSQRRQQGSATGTMDVFAVLGQINEQLGGATDLEAFLKITVGVIQDLCRFHRVLIYQFDEAYNGQVVAELVEWGKTNDLYKGLMFPAADIPAQARQLYKINKVRMLYDRSQTTARLVLRSKEDLDHPLDMTHCYLRAMSPIHIKYLANMHVRSSMSVSIMAFGQLWGLIACHSYGHHGTRVSFPVRQMMRILSDSISRNIERLSYAQRLHTRKLISTIPTQQHPTGYIVSNADDLLEIFDADSGLLVIGDGCKLLGNNEQGTAMLAIAEFLRIMKFDTLKASNHLAKDYPDLVLPRAQDTIAGLLFVPLTAKAGQDFIVFLRKGQVREVQWAGKPYKDETSGSSASLEPRKSFKTWSETVIGRSRVWTDDQLESAGVLALIYGKFIQVWREKQTAMASNQLTAILLSNTSHAVRTPLSQIINTLELALAGNIDDDTRHMLENSHQASRALLFHVHDLLDLTRIETGNETAFNDPFDLRQSINDAVRLYQTESTRRGLEFKVVMADDLPASVIGDSRKIKTVISNLVANSVKFTEAGYIEVYCGIQKYADGQSREVTLNGFVPIEIVISDSGCGIPNDKLGAMFVTLEGAEEMKASSDNTGLGLGLAVVARIVEQLQGQLRAESEVGVGTRFFFTLQMLARSEEASSLNLRTASDPSDIESDVDARGVVHHRGSSGSGGSILSAGGRSSGGSMVSKAASEIDSFVNDFASSHMMGPVSADDKRLVDAEARMSRPGTFPVTDSSYPVRPSRMDDNAEQNAESPSPVSTPMLSGPPTSPKQIQSSGSTTSLRPSRPANGMQRGYSYHFTSSPTQSPKSPRVPQGSGSRHKKSPSMAYDPSQLSEKEAGKTRGDKNLRILVVEDDPINSQILQKRLKMDKHIAIPVTNGQEAVTFLREDRDIDCVLMDIQMPIMDGRTSANEIRKLEHSSEQSDDITPLRIDGRIPILAVSASLYESDRSNLAQDFDGWLLKPLDFLRVRTLLTALEDPSKRSKEVYQQGQWEKGGFFKADASWAQNHLERSYTAD